jgi:hypothetical protein
MENFVRLFACRRLWRHIVGRNWPAMIFCVANSACAVTRMHPDVTCACVVDGNGETALDDFRSVKPTYRSWNGGNSRRDTSIFLNYRPLFGRLQHPLEVKRRADRGRSVFPVFISSRLYVRSDCE